MQGEHDNGNNAALPLGDSAALPLDNSAALPLEIIEMIAGLADTATLGKLGSASSTIRAVTTRECARRLLWVVACRIGFREHFEPVFRAALDAYPAAAVVDVDSIGTQTVQVSNNRVVFTSELLSRRNTGRGSSLMRQINTYWLAGEYVIESVDSRRYIQLLSRNFRHVRVCYILDHSGEAIRQVYKAYNSSRALETNWLEVPSDFDMHGITYTEADINALEPAAIRRKLQDLAGFGLKRLFREG